MALRCAPREYFSYTRYMSAREKSFFSRSNWLVSGLTSSWFIRRELNDFSQASLWATD